jgi:methylenetetrahydrofolate reductase (NADPH)
MTVSASTSKRGAASSASLLLDGFSIEATAKDRDTLRACAGDIAPGTLVAVPFLVGEPFAERLEALRSARELGFEPMPHFAARRVHSAAELDEQLSTAAAHAGVRSCLIIAGDAPEAEGPFLHSLDVISMGALERHGITQVGIGGHPDGHPHLTTEQGFEILGTKCAEITRRGMSPVILTQFAFDGSSMLTWLTDLRARGIDAPVRLGIPGPAGVKTLVRFAARCGVGASKSALAKYGISLGRLLGSSGPESLLGTIAGGLGPEHGIVRLHFFPFGGIQNTVSWIRNFQLTL